MLSFSKQGSCKYSTCALDAKIGPHHLWLQDNIHQKPVNSHKEQQTCMIEDVFPLRISFSLVLRHQTLYTFKSLSLRYFWTSPHHLSNLSFSAQKFHQYQCRKSSAYTHSGATQVLKSNSHQRFAAVLAVKGVPANINVCLYV